MRQERVVLTQVRETGEPAVLLESDLLDDTTIDEPDVVTTEQSRVRRRPDRDLWDGLERVLACRVEVLVKGRAAEHATELEVVETTSLSFSHYFSDISSCQRAGTRRGFVENDVIEAKRLAEIKLFSRLNKKIN